MSTANTPNPARPDQHPLVEMLKLAAPTVATMTSYTLMTFVDKLIVSKIGPDPVYVGAQGNGGCGVGADLDRDGGDHGHQHVRRRRTWGRGGRSAARRTRGTACGWR
jgi:hypothetical protein